MVIFHPPNIRPIVRGHKIPSPYPRANLIASIQPNLRNELPFKWLLNSCVVDSRRLSRLSVFKDSLRILKQVQKLILYSLKLFVWHRHVWYDIFVLLQSIELQLKVCAVIIVYVIWTAIWATWAIHATYGNTDGNDYSSDLERSCIAPIIWPTWAKTWPWSPSKTPTTSTASLLVVLVAFNHCTGN